MSETSCAEVVELMQARAGIYRMFASLYFKELTIDQMRSLADSDLTCFEKLDPAIGEGVRDLMSAVRHVHEVAREDLATDYAHTFLAAGSTKNEKRACPFESVFTSDQGLLMQEARDRVYRLMLEEHVEPDGRLHVPEDHISFECEFMAVLGERAIEALMAGDGREAVRLLDAQRRFHAEHLENWIDAFCNAVIACCRTRFYGGVAKMTRSFIRLDVELMDECDDLLCKAA